MKVIYDKCEGVGSCLVTFEEIAEAMPKNRKLGVFDIEKIIRSLELDNYFDLVYSERKGEPILCINLHVRGLSFKRESIKFRRDVMNRLLLAGISAVATFIIGRILIYVFA